MHRVSTIRSLLLVLIAAAGMLLSGCSPGVKLVGEWEVDGEKLRADVAKESEAIHWQHLPPGCFPSSKPKSNSKPMAL